MKISIRNLTIRSRFYLLLGIIILILILITGFFLNTLKQVENYRNYRAQIDDLNISYLNLRRFEQHFLLRYSEDPAFFTTGENVYIKKHEAASEKFTEIIKELQNNEITSELNLNDNYLNISNYKDAYATIFQELVKKTFARGSEHAGIIGEMNNSSNACIELADNKILKDYSSRMQAQSRAYLSTRDLSFYTDFLYSFTELSDLLSGENPKNAILPVDSSTMVLDLETDSVRIEKSLFVSKEFSEHINNFKTKFIALRKVDKQLGITYKKGLEGKIRDEIHKIDPQMEQIVKHTAEAHALSMKGIKKSVYLFIIGFGALLIILIWQFSRSISMPLKRLYRYIQPISRGVLPKDLSQPKAKDEISDMHRVVNRLIDGLKKTTDFATTLGKGIFDTDYTPLSDEDALGNSLMGMRQNLNMAAIEEKKRKREDDMRKWSNEGIARFNDILRQSPDDIEELSNRVISKLVNYLDANQGAMYIYNDAEKEEDLYLELTAAYAYGRERKRRNKIKPGEGLLGTAAVEKESIYMTDIPQSYLRITSGLGQANPGSLLIVPMKVDEDVFGVIEIASFKEFKSHEISFAEEVSDNISASLSMTKINIRTAGLLKQSQTQAEQMSKQEQEMRHSFEELQETQEESARREAEMASILAAIDNSSLVLEIDTNGIIISANRGMLELLEEAEGRLVGMQHSDFIQMTSAKEYNDLWDKLKAGEHIRRTENVNIGNKEAWISTVYAPIKDESGNIINIMALGTDLTEPKQLEIELKRQAEALSAQEELMRQNLEELHSTQEEMSKKQVMLENANSKLKKNEKALKASIEKSETQEEELIEKVKQLNLVQEQIEKQHSRLIKTNENLELKEKEIRNRFDAVDENNNVAEYSPNGTLIEANETFLKTFGYTAEEVKDKHQRMFIPRDFRRSDEFKQLWQQLRRGDKINEEYKRVDKDGNILFFKGIYTPILDFDGNPIKILEILTDITEQKSTESLLTTRNENIDKSACVIEFSREMEILKVNENFCNTLNYNKEDLIGQEHFIFVPEENRDSERYLRFKRDLKRGRSMTNTFIFIGKKGKGFYLKGTYSGVKDSAGKVQSIVFSGFDTTSHEVVREEVEAIEMEMSLVKKKYKSLLSHFALRAEELDNELEKRIIEIFYKQNK